MKSPRIKWLADVDPDDFGAGEAYLQLLFERPQARTLTRALKEAAIQRFAPKDILRASELKLLPPDDPEVARQLKGVDKGNRLSPLLLVRDPGRRRLIVADGFHRLCAVMHRDAKTPIPCKLA